MDVTSYLLGKQAGGGGSTPTLQNKSVTITENGTTNVTADSGYDGLSEVEVTTNVSGGGGEEYFLSQIDESGSSIVKHLIKNIPDFTITTTSTNPFSAVFDGYYNLLSLPNITWSVRSETNKPRNNCAYLARDCRSITSIPSTYDFSEVTNAVQMFESCRSLRNITQSDFSKVTDATGLFRSCRSVTSFPDLNLSRATTASAAFKYCVGITTAPNITFTKLENVMEMFAECTNLENVPLYDTSRVRSFWLYNFVANCLKLTDTSLDNILQMCINATNYTGTKTLVYIGITDATVYPTTRIQALPHYQDFINAGWTIGY